MSVFKSQIYCISLPVLKILDTYLDKSDKHTIWSSVLRWHFIYILNLSCLFVIFLKETINSGAG